MTVRAAKPICVIQMKTAMEKDIVTANIVFAYPTTTFYRIAHIMDVSNTNIFIFLITFQVFSLAKVANNLLYILYYFLFLSY